MVTNDYNNLVDIRTVKREEISNRVENALSFIKQIGNHTLFKVDRDVVEIKFMETNKTLSDRLVSYLQQMNKAEQKSESNDRRLHI